MTSIKQFYLLKLIEECAEIAQVASKQMQFGKHSDNKGKLKLTNCQHLRAEVDDLLAVLDVLTELEELPEISPAELIAAKNKKQARILRYLRYSQELGLVEKDAVVKGCIECDYCGNHIPL